LRIEIRKLTKNDIIDSDECFLTNTSMEIVTVIKIDTMIIGNGKAGKTTKQLHADFKAFISEFYGTKTSKNTIQNRKK
jgi:branched-subunit amino acid aminotransferase/4-amino-4-deoxychorismate lyase